MTETYNVVISPKPYQGTWPYQADRFEVRIQAQDEVEAAQISMAGIGPTY